MDKRILLVTGWCQSAELYKQLAEDLDAAVDVINPLDIRGDRVQHICEMLHKSSYDCAIGCSMGANLLLRAFNRHPFKTKLILISPVYKGLSLPHVSKWLSRLVLRLPLTNVLARYTVNDKKALTPLLLEAARSSNVVVAAEALDGLFDQSWTSINVSSAILILGQFDKVVRRKGMLQLDKDIPKLKKYIIPDCGHTLVTEAYISLLNAVRKECGYTTTDIR